MELAILMQNFSFIISVYHNLLLSNAQGFGLLLLRKGPKFSWYPDLICISSVKAFGLKGLKYKLIIPFDAIATEEYAFSSKKEFDILVPSVTSKEASLNRSFFAWAPISARSGAIRFIGTLSSHGNGSRRFSLCLD
jgi:hypothetical protein